MKEIQKETNVILLRGWSAVRIVPDRGLEHIPTKPQSDRHAHIAWRLAFMFSLASLVPFSCVLLARQPMNYRGYLYR
jgi:hypothetical protein